MDHILLCTNHIPLTTSIHNSFIEDYMLEANGSYVKVYLYLAKCIQYGEQGLSINSLADRMDNTEKDILRALQYWEKKNLLKINRKDNTGEIVGIDMLAPALQRSRQMPPLQNTETRNAVAPNTEIQSTAAQNVAPPNAKMQSTAAQNVTPPNAEIQNTAAQNVAPPNAEEPGIPSRQPNDIPTTEQNMPMADLQNIEQPQEKTVPASNVVPIPIENAGIRPDISISSEQRKLLAENKEFVWLCNVIESYLDRTLNANELELVSYLYGNLHFSKDLLLHLYDYCISMGKTNYKYIQKVALSWDEQGIHTPEEAEQAAKAYNTAYTSVARALALDRALAPVEKKRVDCWQKEWGMDLSVILEACNRTILKLHKVDFNYIEGILEHWRQAGVQTLQGVERADQTYMQNKAEKTHAATGAQAPKPKNQFQRFQQRETSAQEVDELEQKLLLRQ